MSHKIRLAASFNPSSPLISNSGSASELYHRPTAAGKASKAEKTSENLPKHDNEYNNNDTNDKTDSHRNIPSTGHFAQKSISMSDGNRLYPPGYNPSTPSISTQSRTPSPTGYGGHGRQQTDSDVPRIWGLPLKYVSLVTLAVQNASLAIIMHYSRVSVPSDKVYSAASAVLVNEILKGTISFAIAYVRLKPTNGSDGYESIPNVSPTLPSNPSRSSKPLTSRSKFQTIVRQVASPDSWKLSIPAILYVLQNNLQFVAVSNLDVPTFQVTNQMKILTTAAFSVLLLRKRLTGWKWASLALLAVGVAIVQIQASTNTVPHNSLHSEPTKSAIEIGDELGPGQDAVDSLPVELHPIRGFLAVTAACFTSGLAGVYFEMVLKGSSADLWVRNVQLSMWSLIPAFFPVVVGLLSGGQGLGDMFKNFGGWAWITVITQVSGGLITAVVIKYSDNILKGFATSLSIILSFLASVAMFNHQITLSFVIGASIVLGSTWMYNSPDKKSLEPPTSASDSRSGILHNTTDTNGVTTEEDGPLNNRRPHIGERSASNINVFSPMEQQEPLLGYANGHTNVSTFHRTGYENKGSIGSLMEKAPNGVGSRGSGDEKGSENEKGYEMGVRSSGSSSNG